MVWERAGRLAGLAGGRSGSPLAHSVGTCLHWASPGFSVGVGLIRGQKFSAASLGATCGGDQPHHQLRAERRHVQLARSSCSASVVACLSHNML